MLEKAIDPKNQRTRIITLTGKGEKAIADIKRNRLKIHNALIAALDLGDNEQKMAIRILERTLPKMYQIINRLHHNQKWDRVHRSNSDVPKTLWNK